MPEAITTAWEYATLQTCIIHLIGNTFRFASKKYWEKMSRDLKPVYAAPSGAVAKEKFAEFMRSGAASIRPSERVKSNGT